MLDLPLRWPVGGWLAVLGLLGVLAVTGCAPLAPAPVEDRGGAGRSPVSAPAPTARRAVPAVHTVQRGDTLYSIAFRYGLDWRDLAAWNRIVQPYVIRPGQELRLVAAPSPAPAQTVPSAPAQRPVPAPEPRIVEPRVAEAPAAETRPQPEPAPSGRVEPARPGETVSRAPAAAAPPAAVSDGPSRNVAGVSWRWPAEGRVVRPFDAAATRRGIGIGGRAGQPVVAAADGQVVYSGTALIGYGELIIIKHSDTMLSAYAHNRVRLVQEGAQVRSGQQIAEMGISDRNEELLHFEIRRNGQPENPLNFLPRR